MFALPIRSPLKKEVPMRTRLLISGSAALALALLLVPEGLAPQEDLVATLSAIEESLWEGWKNEDAAPFRQHLVDNFVSIGRNGWVPGKQELIGFVEQGGCDVKGASFSDWAVHRVSEDTAIITYRAVQDAICEGVKIPENVIASAVYVRQNGTWMCAAYHETPAVM
jgi:hypothetical protein